MALLAGAILVPWVTTAAGGRAERRTAQARGDLSAQVRELLRGATDLVACGAAAEALAAAGRTDARLTSAARRSAWTAGLGAGLSVVLAGAAVIGALVAALPAVSDGRLAGVNLAVVVLLPLAAYESVVALPAAALAVVRVRASAERLAEVVDAPDPVTDPAAPAALPAGEPATSGCAGRRHVVGSAGEEVLHGLDLDLAPGSRVAVVGTSGAGKSTLVSVLVRFVEYGGQRHPRRGRAPRPRRGRRTTRDRPVRPGRARVRQHGGGQPAARPRRPPPTRPCSRPWTGSG